MRDFAKLERDVKPAKDEILNADIQEPVYSRETVEGDR